MKHLKTLGAALVAAAALTALFGVGGASASVICSTTADPCPAGQAWPNGTTFEMTLKSGTSWNEVDTSGNTLNTCTSTEIEGDITNTGSSTTTVTGTVTTRTYGAAGTPCTFTTIPLREACLEIHKIAGTSNGTVTEDACDGGIAENTINTGLFGSCIYGVANGKALGEFSEGSGTGATFTMNAVAEKLSGSNFACPTTSKWTATYVMTKPTNTTFSVSASGS
jgi:hypothetical protein